MVRIIWKRSNQTRKTRLVFVCGMLALVGVATAPVSTSLAGEASAEETLVKEPLMKGSSPEASTGKSVYTGVDHYGVRWFSDAAPASGVHYTTLNLPDKPVPVDATTAADETVKAAQANVAGTTAAEDASVAVIKPNKKARRSAKQGASASTQKAAAFGERVNLAKSSVRSRARTVDRAAEREARQQARRCQRYEADLRKIADQLRAGYHARTGRKLHQRQRQLEDQQYAECPTRSI